VDGGGWNYCAFRLLHPTLAGRRRSGDAEKLDGNRNDLSKK